MSLNNDAFRDAILSILLTLPEEDRANVFLQVRHNDIFCCSCGSGSVERPNPDCQCENDE